MQPRKEIKERIADSFRQLVLEKSPEKITIKEITDRAGVIRSTFYNHFQDKYDLLEWICRKELMEPIRALLQNKMEREAMTFVFTVLQKNKEFYERVARLEGQNSFSDIVRKCISEAVMDFLRVHAKSRYFKYEWLTQEWIAQYYTQNLVFVLMAWIQDGMRIPPSDMVDIYEYIASHSMMDLPVEF